MSKPATLSIDSIVSQKEGNISSDMDGETVMLGIQNGKYYNLGEIGGDIWDRMKDSISTRELIHQLTACYEVEASACEMQVLNFLQHLYAEGLVSVCTGGSK